MPEPAAWRVEFASVARRDLSRLDPQVRGRVLEAIERLAAADPRSDVRKLGGKKPPSWRLRVGGWRVIFERDRPERVLVVIAVRARGSAY